MLIFFLFWLSFSLSHSILNENNNPQFQRWCEIYNVDNDSMFIAVASFRITFIWFLFIFLSPLTCFFFGFFLSLQLLQKRNKTIWLLCWFYIKIEDFSFASDILNVSKLFLLTISVVCAHLVHLAHLILKIEMYKFDIEKEKKISGVFLFSAVINFTLRWISQPHLMSWLVN